MAEITTLDSRVIYQNKWMTLREDKILRPSGSEGIYGVVEKADFVVVLAVEQQDIYLVEQYRYPIGKRCLELPQGSWESQPDAAPAVVAAGELREETGLIAGKLEYVASQYMASAFCNQRYHIFLATELTQSEQQLDEEEEGLLVRRISLATFEAMILSGEIADSSTVNAYGLVKMKGLL
ncbi:NUDIX domain-containing protein [Aliagarivorans marinus]|uniref:NUDIX domain-containing protein n=1 Tax=Aliagarivorans marinus TaxID=561965 RepID=UPI000408E6EB|nr:NUDIX hydrolase [Aliagarivorans marinus]